MSNHASGAASDVLARRNRVDWVDYAKGICIVWVVTLYSTEFVQANLHATGWMQHVADFAQPFRMPDFFMLSGLFVARVLDKPWRSYLDGKVLHFAYFYVLWGTLKFLNMEGAALLGPNAAGLLPDYLRMFVEPPTGPLWFLYLLAVFFIMVRLVKSWPPLLVLLAAIALEIAVANTEFSFKVGDKFCRYFVFFYSGYLFSRHIFRAAGWMQQRAHLAWATFAAWFVLNGLLVIKQVTFLPGMQLVLGYIGAWAIMLLAGQLACLSSMNWLRYLGRNSIVVYLGFVVPLGLLRRFVVASPFGIDAGTLSLLVTVLSVGGAILLYLALRGTPLRFLYVRPAWASIAGVRRPAFLDAAHARESAGVLPEHS
jgi:uncharacterized membrane protein YcfT